MIFPFKIQILALMQYINEEGIFSLESGYQDKQKYNTENENKKLWCFF